MYSNTHFNQYNNGYGAAAPNTHSPKMSRTYLPAPSNSESVMAPYLQQQVQNYYSNNSYYAPQQQQNMTPMTNTAPVRYSFNPYNAQNPVTIVPVGGFSSSSSSNGPNSSPTSRSETPRCKNASPQAAPQTNVSNNSMFISSAASSSGASNTSTLPLGTLHTALEGHVSFIPYPTEKFHAQPPAINVERMQRLFIGQLPYDVTDMQLDWLCYTFGFGGAVYFAERITKKDDQRSGNIVHTGCIHAFGDPAAIEGLIAGMNKRILIDDTGVWYAQTAEEQEVMNAYCHNLKVNKKLRFQNRPYDSIVVQYATSKYGTKDGFHDRRHRVRF